MESTKNNPYYLLTNSLRGSLDNLIEKNTLYKKLNNYSIILDVAALISLIYGFINFSDLPYNLLFFILSAAFLSYLGLIIMKVPKENLKKASEAFKGQLLFDACQCETHCRCRRWLGEYLKENRIKLWVETKKSIKGTKLSVPLILQPYAIHR